jgi:hypothetical protein
MFSMRSRAARSTVPTPLSHGARENHVRVGSTSGERQESESRKRARRSDREASKCPVATGVTPTAAQDLVAEHGAQRVVDDSYARSDMEGDPLILTDVCPSRRCHLPPGCAARSMASFSSSSSLSGHL